MTEMTPRERFDAICTGKPIDRNPIILYDNLFAANLADMSYRESELTAEAIATKLTHAYRMFGHDGSSFIYSTKSLVAPLGTQRAWHRDTPATIAHYALDEIGASDTLSFSEVKKDTCEYIHKIIEACHLFQKWTDGEGVCRIHIPAPFTACGGVIAPEKLLRAMRKDPDRVHQLLEEMTTLIKARIAPLLALEGTYLSLSDPLSSNDLISPKFYEKFCLSPTKDVVQFIHCKQPFVAMHICGQTTKMLSLINQTGINAFSCDQVVDLNDALTHLDEQIDVMGHVDPVAVLLQRDEETIRQEIEAAFASIADKKRYWLAPGCDVPAQTSVSHLKAYMDAAKIEVMR